MDKEEFARELCNKYRLVFGSPEGSINIKNAIEFYRAQAKSDREAQFIMGKLHKEGWFGVVKDLQKSKEYNRAGARQDCATAQFNLGCLHESGAGVPQDREQAVNYFKMAVANGHRDAASSLVALRIQPQKDPLDAAQRLRRRKRCDGNSDANNCKNTSSPKPGGKSKRKRAFLGRRRKKEVNELLELIPGIIKVARRKILHTRCKVELNKIEEWIKKTDLSNSVVARSELQLLSCAFSDSQDKYGYIRRDCYYLEALYDLLDTSLRGDATKQKQIEYIGSRWIESERIAGDVEALRRQCSTGYFSWLFPLLEHQDGTNAEECRMLEDTGSGSRCFAPLLSISPSNNLEDSTANSSGEVMMTAIRTVEQQVDDRQRFADVIDLTRPYETLR